MLEDADCCEHQGSWAEVNTRAEMAAWLVRLSGTFAYAGWMDAIHRNVVDGRRFRLEA